MKKSEFVKREKIPGLLRAVCGGLLMLVLGAMYAWSYFKVELNAVYPGWSQTKITLNFTIMMSCFCCGGLAAGTVLKSWSKTKQLLLSALLLGVGYWGVSALSSAPDIAIFQLYAFYGVLIGFGTGIAYNAVLSAIPSWFPSCPSLISGILLMAMGFGSLLLGNLAAVLIPALSLKATFRVFALGTAAVLILGAPIVRAPTAEPALPVSEKKTACEQTRSVSTAEMLRQPAFWIYFVWNLMVSSSGMLIINSASSLTVYFGLAASIGLLVSVFNGLGRLAFGSCLDRIGWKKTMLLANGTLLLSGALLCIGDRLTVSAVVVLGMLIMGICYGGGITISAGLIRTLYGSRYYAANFSVCNLCIIPASLLGPVIAAALQDSTVGYTATFRMVIAIGIIAMPLCLLVCRLATKKS